MDDEYSINSLKRVTPWFKIVIYFQTYCFVCPCVKEVFFSFEGLLAKKIHAPGKELVIDWNREGTKHTYLI